MGRYSLDFISLQLKNGTNKLEFYITLGWKSVNNKHSFLLFLFVSYEENELLWIQLLVIYSQHFI
jgi:hypothetical protein